MAAIARSDYAVREQGGDRIRPKLQLTSDYHWGAVTCDDDLVRVFVVNHGQAPTAITPTPDKQRAKGW